MKDLIMITGASGFVGKHLTKILIQEKRRIKVLVRDDAFFRGLTDSNVEVLKVDDIFDKDEDWWTEQCREVSTIIHLAWYAEPGKYLHSKRNLACLEGSVRMAVGAAEGGVRRVIGVGTCFEYDLSRGLLSVSTPLRPSTLYASAKAATFLTLSSYLESLEVSFAWCRLFYLYGEGEDERRLIPYIRKQIKDGQVVNLSEGYQVRDYMNVSDAARMLAEIATSDRQGCHNICSGIPSTIREIANGIADEFGRRDLLSFGTYKANDFEPPVILGVINT